jgi:hypothetical protein
VAALLGNQEGETNRQSLVKASEWFWSSQTNGREPEPELLPRKLERWKKVVLCLGKAGFLTNREPFAGEPAACVQGVDFRICADEHKREKGNQNLRGVSG